MTETRIYEVAQAMALDTVDEWQVEEVAEEFTGAQSVEAGGRVTDLEVTYRVPVRMAFGVYDAPAEAVYKARDLIEARLTFVDASVDQYCKTVVERVDDDE